MSEQRYIEIPGSKTHELPPLLLHVGRGAAATDLTAVMLEAEDMLGVYRCTIRKSWSSASSILPLQLTEQYKGLRLALVLGR